MHNPLSLRHLTRKTSGKYHLLTFGSRSVWELDGDLKVLSDLLHFRTLGSHHSSVVLLGNDTFNGHLGFLKVSNREIVANANT